VGRLEMKCLQQHSYRRHSRCHICSHTLYHQSLTLGAGLLRVLGCVSNATAVHLFGFNWSAKHYFTHQMSVRAPAMSGACLG